MGTHRKTDGTRVTRVVSAAFARRPRHAMASARSRANSRGRRTADRSLLLSPVMILPRLWIVWTFRKLTGEIFFRDRGAGRAGAMTGASPGIWAGQKSPVPKCQTIDFVGRFGMKIFPRCVAVRLRGGIAARPAVRGDDRATAGTWAGRKSPVPKCQTIDFVGCFGMKIFPHISDLSPLRAGIAQQSAVRGSGVAGTAEAAFWHPFALSRAAPTRIAFAPLLPPAGGRVVPHHPAEQTRCLPNTKA